MDNLSISEVFSKVFFSIISSCTDGNRDEWEDNYQQLGNGIVVNIKQPCKKEYILSLQNMIKILSANSDKSLWIVLSFKDKDKKVLHLIMELNMNPYDLEMWEIMKDQFIICLLKARSAVIENHPSEVICYKIYKIKPKLKGNVIYVDSFYSTLRVPNISIVIIS